jgi:hypothetical protein
MSVVIPSLRAAIAVPPWVKNELWRRARAVPSLDLRFADNKSLVDAVTGASLVTFTRASSKTVTNSAGVLETVGIDVPAFDHNPITGESLGLLVEEQRTNLVLNSATLSTQSVTVAAAANTLSFYGTGTVTLTGVSTAGPLVGTGANDRVSLTFTPIVGVLVLTVSGSVTNAQLEAGALPTSYIPTTTAAVTRSADVVSITGSAFSSWYRQDEGTVFGEGRSLSSLNRFAGFSSGSFSEAIALGSVTTASAELTVRTPTTTTAVSINVGPLASSNFLVKHAAAYRLNDFGVSNAGNIATVLSGAIPANRNQMTIGVLPNNFAFHNGTIRRICFWPQRLANSTLQQLTQ